MPKYIIKAIHPDFKIPVYAMWSTVVDAPVSEFMNLCDFLEYCRDYGYFDDPDFAERLYRVEKYGTSAYEPTTSVEELVEFNRAGENETCIGLYEIIRDNYRLSNMGSQ